MKITHKHLYDSCPKKLAARESTIIDPYRRLYGHCLPADRQYWTMSAICINDHGIVPGSELDQMLRAELIEPFQFHGVDIDEKVFELNQTDSRFNWYCDDFLETMVKKSDEDDFRPAIVNCDTTNMPRYAADKIARIMLFLEEEDQTDVMIVANIVLGCYTRRSSTAELIEYFCDSAPFRSVWNKNVWRLFGEEIYIYRGTHNKPSTTEMGSIVFAPVSRLRQCA